jgi:hypothetical protein
VPFISIAMFLCLPDIPLLKVTFSWPSKKSVTPFEAMKIAARASSGLTQELLKVKAWVRVRYNCTGGILWFIVDITILYWLNYSRCNYG